MRYVVDTHTHTVASGHAYSTITENVRAAAEKGIKILAVTDHGPKMPGASHEYYFGNLKVLPREIMGVTVIRGCEANIVDHEGNIDISDWVQDRLELIIASFHEPCIKPGNRDENTTVLLKAMDNPNIHIIGHSGNPVYPLWAEQVVKKAKEKDIIIEINNGSFSARKDVKRTVYLLQSFVKSMELK